MKLSICFLVILFAALLFSAVLAVNVGTDIAGEAAVSGGYAKTTSETTLAETVGLVISVILAFTGAIFLGLMVFAGILWMTAAGEEEKIKKAQKIILATIIGLVIVVGAFLITNYLVPAIIAATKGGNIGLSMATPVFAVEVKDSAMEQINAAAGKAEIDAEAIPTQMIIINAIMIALGFVGIIFVGLIVYGGFLLFTANGEEEKVKKGTDIIKAAVIGFIVVMLSYAVTTFIGDRVNPLVSQGGVVEK